MQKKTLILFLRHCEKVFILNLSVLLLVIFFMAYFNNGQITVYVNAYGEANMELMLIFTMSIIMVINYVLRDKQKPKL